MSCDAGSSATSHSSPWQKSALFAVSIVGAVCDRAFFLELTKCGRSQTAPTVGNPSLRLLARAVSGLALRGAVLLPEGEGHVLRFFATLGTSGLLPPLLDLIRCVVR